MQTVGLDQPASGPAVDSWHRHTTLVMLAHALLTVIAAHERTHNRPTTT